ncbi:rCG57258 [Rattus norvegicus]|uniref:RCG57258 n=1 Tax=Rattus norvegicus TaxID=10116 RepID=A6KT13_RAT|nr:rCG57258 [Rattus norvegicus]
MPFSMLTNSWSTNGGSQRGLPRMPTPPSPTGIGSLQRSTTSCLLRRHRMMTRGRRGLSPRPAPRIPTTSQMTP